MRGDNDEHGEERRPADLASGLQDGRGDRSAISTMLLFRQAPENIFHDDHRAIDDDPKIHRAEGEEIGGYTAPGQADERREQRKRNHYGHDRCRPHIAEEQEKDTTHENGAFEQVFENGLERRIDQPGAIVKRNDLDTFRQNRTIQHPHAVFHASEHEGWILPFAHENDPGDNVVSRILPNNPLSRYGADPHVGNVLH